MACVLSAGALAQVYSWRDPQSGQLQIATVPPSWLRSPDTAARGPHVNVIHEGKVVPPERLGPGGKVLEPPPPGKPGEPGAAQAGAGAAPKPPSLPELLEKRNALLARLISDALRLGPASANRAFFGKMDDYLAVSGEADAVDPAGAGARNAERDFGMQRVKANIERVLRDPAPRAEFQGEATSWLSKKSDLTAQRIVRCLRDGLC
ncbi:MAG TPA: hypothetical protein VIH11_06695 [Gemmatimonadaceae bacterium]